MLQQLDKVLDQISRMKKKKTAVFLQQIDKIVEKGYRKPAVYS